MRINTFLLLVILSSSCMAQDVFSIYTRLAPPSPSSGNGVQAGIGFDGVIHTGKHFMFDIDASVVYEPKTYVGDGWSFRGQAEGLVRVSDWYFGGGINGGRHVNSQYTKNQYMPIASIHYRPDMKLDLYGTYLFPASGNENNVTGFRFGYRGTYRRNPGSKWGVFTQVEVTHFKFTTAFGERLGATGVTSGIGVSRIVEKIQ